MLPLAAKQITNGILPWEAGIFAQPHYSGFIYARKENRD
jgi:hypothetical protein